MAGIVNSGSDARIIKEQTEVIKDIAKNQRKIALVALVISFLSMLVGLTSLVISLKISGN